MRVVEEGDAGLSTWGVTNTSRWDEVTANGRALCSSGVGSHLGEIAL